MTDPLCPYCHLRPLCIWKSDKRAGKTCGQWGCRSQAIRNAQPDGHYARIGKLGGKQSQRVFQSAALERVRHLNGIAAYQRGYMAGYSTAYRRWRAWAERRIQQQRGAA